MYDVFKLPIFEKKSQKILNYKELQEVQKIIEQLKINPYIGRPLNYPYLREKKIKDKRIYFLVYENITLVLIVSTSDKKSQQETINYIKSYLSEFKEYAYKLHQELKEKEDNN